MKSVTRIAALALVGTSALVVSLAVDSYLTHRAEEGYGPAEIYQNTDWEKITPAKDVPAEATTGAVTSVVPEQ